MMERETAIEVAASVGAVALFIAALVAIGTTYYDGSMSSEGAFALIGLIVGFIVLMAAVGYYLSAREG